MDQHFLDRCLYVSIFKKKHRFRIVRGILGSKKMAEQFSNRCLGIVFDNPSRFHVDFLISANHPQLMKNLKGMQEKKKASGLREKYIKNNIYRMEKDGVTPVVGDSLDLESIVPFVDGSVKIMVDSNNKIIIPYMLSYQDWVAVAKATFPEKFSGTSSLTRRRAIFTTIRHSIGIYDQAWKKLPEKCYGYVCRRLVQMVCKHFPELDTIAKEWLEHKSEVTDVDQFDLDNDLVVGSDKFYWLPDDIF